MQDNLNVEREMPVKNSFRRKFWNLTEQMRLPAILHCRDRITAAS